MHIISGDVWAGAEVQVYHTLSALTKKEDLLVTCVLFNNGILEKKLKKKNIKTIVLDETRFNNFSLLYKLSKIIRNEAPHIIHVHAVKEHFLVKCSSILSRNVIPIIRTVHGARKSPDNLPFKKSLRSNSVVFLDNFLITYAADAIIAVSKSLEQEFYKRKVKGTVYQIYNAINTLEYDLKNNQSNGVLRESYGAKDCFWIGTAARLAEPKNLQMLIKAGQYLVEREIPFKISIFGDGPLKQELQNLIERYALSDKVELHGFELEIQSVINALDVFVLCSIHEGLPMALLEAMFLKTPVVCTEVIGIQEVVENGVNGLLVPLNDSNALAESLITLYHKQDLASKLANHAKVLLDEKFSLSKTNELLCNLYYKF